MLLERDPELEAMLAIFDAVAVSGGRVALVCGEAGIGKSSLIGRLVDRVKAEHAVALGLCDPLDTPRPLGPIRDIARALTGDRVGEGEEALCFDGLLERLAGADGPILLVVEDLHWADERTLDWLKFLVRRIAQVPAMLVLSFRDDELDAGHPVRSALGLIPASRAAWLPLAPLSLDAVRLMAGPGGPSPEVLHDVTGGNPFFLTELLSAPVADGPVPRSVAEAINARLNTLPDETVAWLEQAACWPGPVPRTLLESLPAVGPPSALDLALRRRILVEEGGGVGFRHELARLAVRDRMEPGARARGHAKYLAALTAAGCGDGADVDLVVYHALNAGDDAALLRFAPIAAARAAGLGAHREAARHLAHALRLADRLTVEQAAELHEIWAYEAGLALVIDADVIAARRRAVDLWRLAGRPDRVGENLWWLSRLHWYRGEAETAQRYLAEAIALLEFEAPSPAKAKALALRAQFYMLQDCMDDAADWARRALAMADAVGDEEIRVHALNTLGSALLFRGDWSGEPPLRESLALALRRGLHEQAARVYTNLSECLIELRALDRAEVLIEEGIAFDTAHDLDSWTFYLVGRKAQLRLEQDRCDEAAAIARDVLARENQTLLMKMPSMIVLARSLMRRSPREAAEWLLDTREAAERIAEPQYLAAVAIAELELAALTGETGAAAAAVAWLEGVDAALLSPRKRGEAVFWARLAGSGTFAHLGAPDGLPPPFALLSAGACSEASDAFRAEASNHLAAWALVAAGDAALMPEADRLLRECGAVAARRRIRALGWGAGLPALERGPYRAARGHPLGLTAKEQQILRLMVEGATNATIAETIGRSRRTVENHVSSILSKMQASSRLDVMLRIQGEPSLLRDPRSEN